MSQSAETRGGTGFTYQNVVVASYLAAVLAEAAAPGTQGRVVYRVSQQQDAFGEPLDDVVIDFRSSQETEARLSLQITRSLTVSRAPSNDKFRRVIHACWDTLSKPDFREGVDRFGCVVDDGKQGARALQTLCEMARGSLDAGHFASRFDGSERVSKDVRGVKGHIAALLEERLGTVCPPALLHRFLGHFVLVRFDYLHEGTTQLPACINLLRTVLADSHTGQASLVWNHLCQLASQTAGTSDQFDRTRLVRTISPEVRLRGARSLAQDLRLLTAVAFESVRAIEDDVGGTRLERESLNQALDEALRSARYVQIRGLAGVGKSALLRRWVERALKAGPVLFLKSDRLKGFGWRSFANSIGLSAADLTELLVEVEAVGSNTLFIDGIDRVSKEHQLVVQDIVRTVLESPSLSQWRIVVTLRDAGIEPLRNWLPTSLLSSGVGHVHVGMFDDAECKTLAVAMPKLEPLLFGSVAVREIARRPFFAKIVSRNLALDPQLRPQSETDLVQTWWLRGGYNCDEPTVISRQRALIELAGQQAQHLGTPLSVSQISPEWTGLIHELVNDGILQHVREGHSVRFAHDIFFEWAFFRRLLGRGDEWLEELRMAGEPPGVARAVELLSQSTLPEGQPWLSELRQLLASNMRSQWTRAWLLGPWMAPDDDAQGIFAAATQANDCELLRKALVWLQAEKTIPNPPLLAAREIAERKWSPDEYLRMADLGAWPSDLAAWARAIGFVLGQVPSLRVIPLLEITAVFEVWQNYAGYRRNPVSDALIAQCDAWLTDIESRHDAQVADRGRRLPWATLDTEARHAQQSLRQLLVGAATTAPDRVTEYLKRLLSSAIPVRDRLARVIENAFILAQTHPKLLVEIALAHFREDLPEEVFARHSSGGDQASGQAHDSESSLKGYDGIGPLEFSYRVWDELSVYPVFARDFPASPLGEPFHSLFQKAPVEALRLLRELSHHAITAWRQLQQLERRATPIALEVSFPWGTQRFWGGSREFLWHRGFAGPGAIAGGYLALENWAFAKLERGADADTLIRQIVEGHDDIAVLGSALLIALQAGAASETALALVVSQRLWRADEFQTAWKEGDWILEVARAKGSQHMEALSSVFSQPVRKLGLRDLALSIMRQANTGLGERLHAAILDFPDHPPFELEEEQQDSARREKLIALSRGRVGWVERSGYSAATRTDVAQGPVEDRPAGLDAPHEASRLAAPGQTQGMENSVLDWADQCLKRGEVGEGPTIAGVIGWARQFDIAMLYQSVEEADSAELRRGAVAAVAAVVLRFPEQADVPMGNWALDVVSRAARAIPTARFMSSASIIPWHYGRFAARGLAAAIRYGCSDTGAALELLRLVVFPLQGVAQEALHQVLRLWDRDPWLTWCALDLVLSVAYLTPFQMDWGSSPVASDEPDSYRELLELYCKRYETDADHQPVLPRPPSSWMRYEPRSGRPESLQSSDELERTPGHEKEHWRIGLAAQALRKFPHVGMLSGTSKDDFIALVGDLFDWTLRSVEPLFTANRRLDVFVSHDSWHVCIGERVAELCGGPDVAMIRSRFLEPMFSLDHEQCFFLLAPLVDRLVRNSVLSGKPVSEQTVAVLDLCLTRLLASPKFIRGVISEGAPLGEDLADLVHVFLLVKEWRVGGTSQRVNLQATTLRPFLELQARLLHGAGRWGNVVSAFLTLCENTREHYPAGLFAEIVLAVADPGNLIQWRSTSLPARIATLVQNFANRESPMALSLARSFLRILDLLVDIGDRRSAALQLSESFRNVRADCSYY